MRSSCLLILWVAVAFADVTAIREMIRAGRFAEAAAACDIDLKKAPGSPALLTLRGMALRGAGDSAAALRSFRLALRGSPAYLPALQAAAQIEFETRDARARTTLESIVRLEPANPIAHAMLAELAFDVSDWPGVISHTAKVELSPLVRWRRGVALFSMERYKEAAADFGALLSIRDHAPTRYNLALSHWRAGDAAATVAALAAQDDADALSLRAAALRGLRRVPEALETLQRAVQKFPRDERLLVELAQLCLDQNAVELGIQVLEAGVTNNPASVRLLTALGVFRVRAGQTDAGETLFARARTLAPGAGLGEVATATAMMQLGLAGDAVALLRKLPEGEPMVALSLARALVQQDATKEAKQILAALIAREPRNSAARSLHGKLLANEGATKAAVMELEAALRLDSNDRAAAYQLLGLYRKLGRAADASRVAARVRELMAREKADDLEAQRYQLSLTAANE